jgi:circadian clock protein KaiC
MRRLDDSVPRALCGIPEFDQMLGVGFMRNDAVLVAGNAGTGKTTLGLQFLANGITKYGENGLYVTFEEMPDQLYRDALNFGWDLRQLEKAGKLKVICTNPILLLETGEDGALLDDPIAEVKAKRIVVDSLSHLQTQVSEGELRSESYRLIMYLKRKGLTSLLTAEIPQNHGHSLGFADEALSFLVDAIVLLRPVEIQSSMKKAIAILKMRGSDHDKELREYEITSKGFKFGSPFSDYEGILSGNTRKVTRMEETAERFSQAFAGNRKKA